MSRIKGYMPIVKVCEDFDNCQEEHNEIIGWDKEPERAHHYGCECHDCMMYYYLHLK